MINGVHSILYAHDAEKVRDFFRDVLEIKHIDAGHGWLIFALPPSELGIHPAEAGEEFRCEMYLMCDNIQQTLSELRAKNVECGDIVDQRWGLLSTITIPGGGRLGIYQPRHPRAA